MKKLSKYEKETIINWNEAENLASIYTFNASGSAGWLISAGSTRCCAGWSAARRRAA